MTKRPPVKEVAGQKCPRAGPLVESHGADGLHVLFCLRTPPLPSKWERVVGSPRGFVRLAPSVAMRGANR